MMRILFVDDEPLLLRAFEALFRKHRARWSAEFALGGRLGIDALSRSEFDVVITDLRMPGVDGIAVLRHVEAHHPDTVRVLLSGGAERGTDIANLAIAHQSIAKPCTSRVLENVLERAGTLRTLVGDPAVRHAVGRVRDLPPLPRTHQRLTAVLGDERAGLDDIAAVISADIAVAAKVLKLANSAIFSGGRSIPNIRQAVVQLGIETIKSVVLAAAVFDPALLPPASYAFADKLHEHSCLVAALAAHLVSPDARNDAFAAGVLHDVGSMIIERHRGTAGAASAEELEHSKIGAYLLALWGMPAAIVDAVARHEEDGSVPPLAHAIQQAESIIVEVAGDRYVTTDLAEQMHQAARDRGKVLRAAVV